MDPENMKHEYVETISEQEIGDHQHVRHVAIGDGVAIRYCTICGLSHILNKNINTWILIKEE